MSVRSGAAEVLSSASPVLSTRLTSFRVARDAFAGAPRVPRTIAVVGLTPREGRSTVTALLVLAASGYSARRVVVVDAVTPPVGPRPPVAGGMSLADPAGRTVTSLLGGDVGQGRLGSLLDGPLAGGIGRRRLRGSFTPGAAVPVLSLPPGPAGFAPQFLEQSLERLRHRADLVVIDTPAGPRAPVLHAVVEQADHFVVVVRADGDLARRIAAVREWLAAAPGRRRRRDATLVVVSRGLVVPRIPPTDLPVVVLRRDEGLRRRRPDRMSRRTVITGLRIATAVLRPE